MKIIHIARELWGFIKSVFISGLLTIIPIAATVFFIHFTYGIVARALVPLRNLEPKILQQIPGFEFIVVMVAIFLFGFILKLFIFSALVNYFERLVSRLPLVRIVYSSAKILANFFKVSATKSAFEKKVVLIPYPRKGQYHLAFLLESAHDSYQDLIPTAFKLSPDERYYKVFMPNSPNPTTGYFFIMPEHEIIHTDITFEEAIKVLVSCGLVTPESLKRT